MKAVRLTSTHYNRNASRHYSKEIVFAMYSSFIVPKGSILQPILEGTVRDLHAFGIFGKMKEDSLDFVTPVGSDRNQLKRFRTNEPLNIWQLAPAMLLVVAGFGLTAILLLVEVVIGEPQYKRELETIKNLDMLGPEVYHRSLMLRRILQIH